MKKGKTAGVDNIDSFSIKVAGPYIKPVLLHLINLSIRSCTFPTSWKIQLIHPLYKKSDKTKPTNYRPVSHIIQIGKLVEYVMIDQMFEHFVMNKIFHSNHHGGLPNHSTATALIQLYDLWLNAAEKHELIAALLLDLSAAYDLLNHSILIMKLLHYGFDSDARKYVKSYLEDRKQIVQVESKQSEPKEIGDTSVPQGSVLGGFFFLVFENDFPASSEDSEACLLYTSPSPRD